MSRCSPRDEAAAVVRLLARIVGDLAVLLLELARLVTGDVALAMFLVDALVGVVDAVLAKGVTKVSSMGLSLMPILGGNHARVLSRVARRKCGSSVTEFG